MANDATHPFQSEKLILTENSNRMSLLVDSFCFPAALIWQAVRPVIAAISAHIPAKICPSSITFGFEPGVERRWSIAACANSRYYRTGSFGDSPSSLSFGLAEAWKTE